MADFNELLKFLAANGEGAIPSQNYQLLEFLKANVAPAEVAPIAPTPAADPISNLPMDNQPEDSIDGFLKNADALTSLLNRTEAAPGNPMQTRVDAINREHNKNGIQASVDSNGRAVFSNVQADSQLAPTVSGSAATPGQVVQEQKGMATNLQGLLGMLGSLNKPEDAPKARGVLAQFNQAFAEEQAKITLQAQTFAQNKLQVPLLEKALAASEAADKISPTYLNNPGIGDSMNTSRMRTALEDARNKADTEATRFLSTNVGYATLKAASTTAQQEVARISRLDDARTNMVLNRQLNSEAKAADRLDKEIEAARALTSTQKDRIRILSPDLAGASDSELLIAAKGHASKKDGYQAAIDAEPEDLIKMAGLGNNSALAILTETEKQAGQDPEITKMRIKGLKEVAASESILKRMVQKDAGSDSILAAKQWADFKALIAPGSTKESKDRYDMMRMDYARQAVAQKVHSNFTADISKWGITDPAIQKAMAESLDVTKGMDMHSVLNAYVGNATGMDRKILLDNFTQMATEAASKTQKSQLGAVDPRKIRDEIVSAETRSFLQRVADTLYSGIPAVTRTGSFGNPMLVLGVQEQLSRALGIKHE